MRLNKKVLKSKYGLLCGFDFFKREAFVVLKSCFVWALKLSFRFYELGGQKGRVLTLTKNKILSPRG
jgi:hypothetical protein